MKNYSEFAKYADYVNLKDYEFLGVRYYLSLFQFHSLDYKCPLAMRTERELLEYDHIGGTSKVMFILPETFTAGSFSRWRTRYAIAGLRVYAEGMAVLRGHKLTSDS